MRPFPLRALIAFLLAPLSSSLFASETVSLADIRRQVLCYADALQVSGKPLGFYFDSPASRNAPSLYATCDVVHMRTVMGEDLQQTLTLAQRQAWIDHINSFARRDGTYGPGRRNHSPEHANGMVIGALGVLGGKQLHPVQFYDAFDTPAEVVPWLEKVDWRKQWSGSHLFWGGVHCFSMSRRCTPAWRTVALDWLDGQLDRQTGWWRKGVPHASPVEPLGGGAHIWPIYQHTGRRFPYPERVIDSILALQKPDGSWGGYGGYLALDALYGLAYMRTLAPKHRSADIIAAVARHGQGLTKLWPEFMAKRPDLHVLLGAVGAWGLLNQMLPETYADTLKWTDIFSDRRLYQTAAVESPKGVSRRSTNARLRVTHKTASTTDAQAEDIPVSLTAWDWRQYNVTFGPIHHLTIEHITGAPDDKHGTDAVRLLPGVKRFSDGTTLDCPIHDITLRDITDIRDFKLYDQPNLELGRDNDASAGVGTLKNIVFEDLAFNRPGSIQVHANTDGLTVRNVKLNFPVKADYRLIELGPKSQTYKRGGDQTPEKWIEIFSPDLDCTVRNLSVSGVCVCNSQTDVPIEQIVRVIAQRLNPDYPKSTPRGGTGKAIWIR